MPRAGARARSEALPQGSVQPSASSARVPRVVVLPGMDGTGLLLSGFIEAARGRFDVEVIAYPNDRSLNYEELAGHVAGNLPKSGRYWLLGESFGGPLALMVAGTRPPGLAGVVLCASFARFPIAPLRWLAPFAKVATLWHPAPIVSWLLLGRWASPPLLARVLEVVRGLRSAVLAARVAAALEVDSLVTLPLLTLPVLVLRATEDRVIPSAASAAVVTVAQAAQLVDIEAPHFMLQTAPAECVDRIAAFIGVLEV